MAKLVPRLQCDGAHELDPIVPGRFVSTLQTFSNRRDVHIAVAQGELAAVELLQLLHSSSSLCIVAPTNTVNLILWQQQ